MTDTKLYLAIGIPALLALVNTGVTLALFVMLNARIQRVEDQLNNLISAVNELDWRLVNISIKLGMIQP